MISRMDYTYGPARNHGAAATGATKSSAAGSFEDQIAAAIAQSLGRDGAKTGQYRVTVQESAGQGVGANGNSRQFIITVDALGTSNATAAAATQPAEAAAAPSPAPAATTNPNASAPVHPFSLMRSMGRPALPHEIPGALTPPAEGPDRYPMIPADNRRSSELPNPVPSLIDTLNRMGVSTAGMKFEVADDVNVGPAGTMTNHLIKWDSGTGIKESFSVEYTLRNPTVTAVEIKRLLGGYPGIPATFA